MTGLCASYKFNVGFSITKSGKENYPNDHVDSQGGFPKIKGGSALEVGLAQDVGFFSLPSFMN